MQIFQEGITMSKIQSEIELLFWEGVISEVETLIEQDPNPDSTEGKRLCYLADLVIRFEEFMLNK
jgi:hypothetical protein